MTRPIETAGKRGYRIEQARHLSVATLLDVGDVDRQVRSCVRAQPLGLPLFDRNQSPRAEFERNRAPSPNDRNIPLFT